MLSQVLTVINFIVNAFLHIWPYLLITIPLAVAVQMTGAAKYINSALQSRPVIAIFLATIVGAFSPFCSCGVIPVVAALLLGGVPLAPVMSFWIASPSMDPEIFFLSVATIGWNLAVWRLVSTLVLSLAAGFVTHFIILQGWLGEDILRSKTVPSVESRWVLLRRGLLFLMNKMKIVKERLVVSLFPQKMVAIKVGTDSQTTCCVSVASVDDYKAPVSVSNYNSGGDSNREENVNCGCNSKPVSFLQRLSNETWKATAMVAKFMALAFFLEALIKLYIPSEWITRLLGSENTFSIFTAVLIGVPMYASNLTALPMIGGLLAQGMNPAAALAFLIAGPTTTLPAMAAVWGITTRRVFVLYLSFSLIGALIFGYLYRIVAGF